MATKTTPPDDYARALKILHDTYWQKGGWRTFELKTALSTHLSIADFEFAKSQGVMFDYVSWSQAEQQDRLKLAASRLTALQVADAFVGSLSTRALAQRCALGSYAFARHFPMHPCVPEGPHIDCTMCLAQRPRGPGLDPSGANFTRHKWAMVNLESVFEPAIDLECFAREHTSRHHQPTAEDREMLMAILNAAEALPATARPAHLEKAIAKIVPSSSAERESLLAILAAAGVLQTKRFPSYRTGHPDAIAREKASGEVGWSERDYPWANWRGSDGVDEAAVAEWFPWAKRKNGKWSF